MQKHLNITLKILMLLLLVGTALYDMSASTGMALAFALPVSFGPLLHECSSENMGGYKNRVLFIPACSVSKVPSLPDEPLDEEDYITAEGSFEFKKEGDKPIFIYATNGTVSFNSENQGDIDGQSFLQSIEFFHPGSKVAVAAFARMVNNTPGYLVIEEGNGQQILIGSKGLEAYIKPAYSGGAERGDRKGFPFTASADSYAPFIVLGSPIDIDELENPE